MTMILLKSGYFANDDKSEKMKKGFIYTKLRKVKNINYLILTLSSSVKLKESCLRGSGEKNSEKVP